MKYNDKASKYHLGIRMRGVGLPKLFKKGKYCLYQLKNGKNFFSKKNERHVLLAKSSTVTPRIINLSKVIGDLCVKGMRMMMYMDKHVIQ
jgi:hypothetical protein